MTEKTKLDLDDVLALFRAANSASCAKYSTSYDGASRERSPKFRPSYLCPSGLTKTDRRRALADLREGCAALAKRGDLVDVGHNSDGSRLYVLATPGVVAEVAEVVHMRDRANALAELLGGEAEHYTTGSYLSLTVDQAEALRAKLGALQDKVDRMESALDSTRMAKDES